jgi:aspartate racemase
MQTPTIGIIGGMGPQAGVYLADRIVANTLAKGDRDHVPFLLASRPAQIPNRPAFLVDARAPNPAREILETADILVRGGCTILGMPCNTAHAPVILSDVLSGLATRYPTVRFLHLIEETAAFCRATSPEVSRIGLLATLGTHRSGIYKAALHARGLEALAPDPEIQRDLVHRSLYDDSFGIKTHSNPVREEAVELLSLATEHLREAGAQAVILGCTELPLAVQGRTFAGLPVIDSTTALARALIRAVAPDRLRPLS